MSSKDDFMKVIRSKDMNSIGTTLRSLFSHAKDNVMADMIDFFTITENAEIWKVLSILCQQKIEYLTETIVLDEEFVIADKDLHHHIESCNKGILTLIDTTKMLSIYAEKLPTYHSDHMIVCLQALHDILIPLNNNHESIMRVPELKNNIARLCEKKFLAEVNGSDGLVAQLLPYLLLTSLSPVAVDADIKRVYALRSALDLFDFEDESIESLRGLLLRCFIQPSYLKLKEGKKFLAHVLNIDSTSDDMAAHEMKVQELVMEVIKPQIVNGTRSVCIAYGDILLRAWKESSSASCRSSLEDALQVLINEAIHTSSRSHHRGLRLLLSAFHDMKREQDVDALLNRLYGPFLWRSLKCANAIIRSQAAVFFFDVFPLQDPDLNSEAIERHLQFQFESLSSLLQDHDHRVRAVAASGACTILREYWEAMPAHETKRILSYLINTLCMDASCAVVRQAAIQGLAMLLDQPLSHAVLKKLLPHLVNSIHDNAEKVRLSFIQLLCKVKMIHGMHYYDIVPLPHILERLAQDHDHVRIRYAISELVQNSFYPQADDHPASEGSGSSSMGALRIKRCIAFIQENLLAAEAFYASLAQLVSVGAATKMCVMLFSLFLSSSSDHHDENTSSNIISSSATTNDKRRKKRTPASSSSSSSVLIYDDHTASSPSFPIIVSDQQMRIGVLRVLQSCLHSIYPQLSQAKYTSSLDLFSKHFTAHHIDAVLYMFRSSSSGDQHDDADKMMISYEDEMSIALKVLALARAVITKVDITSSTKSSSSIKTSSASPEAIFNDLLLFYQTSQHHDASSSSSHHLRVRASLDMIIAMKMEYAFIQHMITALSSSSSAVMKAADGKKKKSSSSKASSDDSMTSSHHIAHLAADIITSIYSITSSSSSSSDKMMFMISDDVRMQMFVSTGDAIRSCIISSTSSSMIGDDTVTFNAFLTFISSWTSYAFQQHISSSHQHHDHMDALVRWIDDILPVTSSSKAISCMLSIIIVAGDACTIISSSSASSEMMQMIFGWLEALLYLIEHAALGAAGACISSALYHRIIQVHMRFATILTKHHHQYEDHLMMEKLMQGVFDVLGAAIKRYAGQLPSPMMKAMQAIYKRINVDEDSSSKGNSKQEVFQHLKSHDVFLNVV